MKLFDALENLAMNLPSAVEDLRALRRDFRETFGNLAREGAELFTLGFEEMVLKDNSDWKTSEENRREARLVALGARDQHPDLARRYEQARTSLEQKWDDLEKCRAICWDALQELDSLLPLEDKPAPDPEHCSWPVWQANSARTIAREGSDAQGRSWVFPSTLANAGPDASEIIEAVEERSYRNAMDNQGGAADIPEGESSETSPWLQQVKTDYGRSLNERALAAAHAADSEGVKITATWECEQLEPIVELVSRSNKIFRAGGIFCMTQSNLAERWREEQPICDQNVGALRDHFTTAIGTAKALVDLIELPLTEEVNGLPMPNPAFVHQLQAVETMLND